jgi:hypothetical protein
MKYEEALDMFLVVLAGNKEEIAVVQKISWDCSLYKKVTGSSLGGTVFATSSQARSPTPPRRSSVRSKYGRAWLALPGTSSEYVTLKILCTDNIEGRLKASRLVPCCHIQEEL